MSAYTGSLTRGQLFSLAFGSIIGVGWIPFVGSWLELAGSLGALLGFLGGCVTVMFVVAAYAELGSMYPVNGGEVSYTQVALGSAASFATGWFLILLYLGFTSFSLISTGWIVGLLIPAIKGPLLYSAFGADIFVGEAAVGLLTGMAIWVLNVRGREIAARLQEILSYSLIVFAILIIGVALFYGRTDNLEPMLAAPAGQGRYGGVLSVFTTALLFYGGFNFAAQTLGERAAAVTPRKIATAMYQSVLAALFFYAAVIWSSAMLLPRQQLLALELPAASLFEVALGSRLLRDAVLLFGLIGLLTSWNGAVYAGSRLLAMLSELRLMPESLGRSHARYCTPANAIALISFLTPLIAAVGPGGIIGLAKALSFAIAFAWAVTVLSAARLRQMQPDVPRPYTTKAAWFVFSIAAGGTVFAMFDTARGFFDPATAMPTIEGVIVLVWSMLGLATWCFSTPHRRSLPEAQRTRLLCPTDSDRPDGRARAGQTIRIADGC